MCLFLDVVNDKVRTLKIIWWNNRRSREKMRINDKGGFYLKNQIPKNMGSHYR